MEHLRCVVERITYQNEENGWTVLKCAAKNYSGLVTVVGTMPETHVGAVLSLDGTWKVDAKYGRQFAAERFEETLPATVYGMEKYLGSGLIKGVGPKFAKRIVNQFGKDTLDIIEEHPERLSEVEGIGKVRVERIKKSWEEQREIKNIMLFLQSHGVSTSHATKIYKTYGADSIRIVQDNPYRLADDIYGIGFRTADMIAEKLGIGKDRFVRLRSGILYTMNRLSESGHCYAGREQLIAAAAELLTSGEPEITMTLDEMLRSGDLICETFADGPEAIYLPPFYHAECGLAKRISRLLAAGRRVRIDTEYVMQRTLSRAKFPYDEVQQGAIRTAISSKIMILTGGPGTGKTTTTTGILDAYRCAGCRILLAAPTGRAAKRMAETTGMEAKTIHRLLEYKPSEGYQRREDNPLDGDVLILDECSMIDLLLMYNLLKAVPDHMTLILVGDTDQLPSVGAGNVLKDLIASGRIPVVRLTRIFRQAQGSRIVMNAHRINRGERIDLSGGPDSDFFFATRTENEAVVETLVAFCTKKLPAYYHADPLTDIQVLTPMQRGVCGAENLNQQLQKAMNPSQTFLRRGGTEYRLHDKVMQIRNDYDKEVFNGDIGRITRVDMEERELTVNFDGHEIDYDVTELDELVLAYAVTIHKAQGSEYPIVVMPLTMSHYVMLQRNLLYTGVTRAKRILVMIGDRRAVSCAIANEKTSVRNTRLAERLNPENTPQPISQTGAVRYLPEEARREAYARETPTEYGGGDLFARLARSEFRSSFSLKANDRVYVCDKGMDTIRSHARDLIAKRLAPAEPYHDGKQTPMRGHPVFIAQHATGTCCRNCLSKWHGIPKGQALTEEQQEYVVDVIMEWIRRQMEGG